jgi:hypothetical protein
MPSAAEVNPEKWSDVTILFDNGEYSVVSGIYERDKHALGERWNGQDGYIGFPNVAGFPIWHVAPAFLAIPILHGLLDELAKHPGQAEEHTNAIIHELLIWHQPPG